MKFIKDFITTYYKMIIIISLKLLIITNTIWLIMFMILLTLGMDLISLLWVLVLFSTLIAISVISKKVEKKLQIN